MGGNHNLQSINLSNFYKRLWSLNIPSKIRIQCWKVANEFVPTLCTLKSRNLAVNTLCPVCKTKEETMSHLFRYYVFLRQVLEGVGVVFSTTNMEHNWKQWLAVEFITEIWWYA